jgi:hypothetical protein
MVRINLLKTSTGSSAPKKRAGVPVWIPIGGVVLLLCAGIGVGIWYFKFNKQQEPLTVVPEVKTDFKPSTHVNPNMLEEVVKEVNDERNNNQKAGFLNLDYDEMSFAEKINYEVSFSKNILDSLSKIIPAGIGFKILEIDNFVTMYSIGLGNSSDIVADIFSKMKERLGLLPQPYSYIKKNDTKGYKFIITCKPKFGVDLVNTYQPFDHLFSKDDLSKKVTVFSSIATRNKLHFKSKPVSMHVEKIREYQRFEFEWSCNGSYKDFVQFATDIFNEQLPCAFKSIHIKATSENNVDISTTVIFTVRE